MLTMNDEFKSDDLVDFAINNNETEEYEGLFDDCVYVDSDKVTNSCETNNIPSFKSELTAKNYEVGAFGKDALSEKEFNNYDYVTNGKFSDCDVKNVSPSEFSAKNCTKGDNCENDALFNHIDSHIQRIKNGNYETNVTAENESAKNCESQISKLSNSMKKKRKKILEAVLIDDVGYLKKAAVSQGGLLSDDIRRKVWPKLIGIDIIETSPRPSREDIESHHYYQQVVLDVNRSLKRFPPSIKEAQRLAMLDQLVLLIMRVLCRHPELHYYQGYHDICVTFLLVLGEETAYYVLDKLSKTHLEVFMKESMKDTIDMLNCMYPLIYKKNPQLANFMLKSEVGVGFCISWLITWFGHVLNEYDVVVRLFDFFLVSDPVMPLYLTTAIILHRQDEALQQDCDMASVHSFLSKVPDDLPFENLLSESLDLFKKYDYTKLILECTNNKVSKGKHSIGLVRSLARRIKSSVPASNFTMPFVIAAAVLVTAVLYQAYKY